MKIKEVARRMEKSELFVREGLKQGLFDFGYAIKLDDKRYNYHVSKKKFDEYMGVEK